MKNKINIYLIYAFGLVSAFATPVYAARQDVEDIDANCDTIFSTEMIVFLTKLWNILVILGPLALIGFTLLDIVKALTLADDSGFKKIINTFIRRFVAVALLILLPVLINFLLGLINSSFSTCI